MMNTVVKLTAASDAALNQLVAPGVRRNVEGLVADLGSWGSDASILDHTLGGLQSLLGLTAAAAHRMSPGIDGWHVDFMHWRGPCEAERARELWATGLATRPRRTGGYNPMRPEPAQRNRALRPYRAGWYRSQAEEPFAEQLLKHEAKLHDTDQLRALICDGPVLLGWVGGWRDRPFARRDVAILQAIVPALNARMRLERDLGAASLHRAALEALIETHAGAVFLVADDGRVAATSRQGAALFAKRRSMIASWLGDALAGRPGRGVRVLPVRARGVPDHHLVIVDTEAPRLAARVRELSDRWRLTPREREVLGRLIEGASNKRLAEALDISLRTVELHVSALLKKSGLERRSEVTACFWSGR